MENSMVALLSGKNGTGKQGKGSFPVKSITETITNGFFTMDRKWTVTYWNKAAEKLLWVKASDIIGKNLWEKFAGIIPLNFYEAYPKAFLLELPFHFQEYWGEIGAWFDVIVYHCDDTLSVSFKSSNPIPTNDPNHPEEQLKIQNELYRFITEVSNDCLWDWDLQTNEIFWIDGGHKKVFGYDIENAYIPRNFWESRVHPEDKQRILGGLNRVINDSTSMLWEDDYRFQKANGEYAYVHDRGYIMYDESKQATRMIGTTLDVTSAKLTSIQLSETEKKLTQAEYWINVQGKILLNASGGWTADLGKDNVVADTTATGDEASPFSSSEIPEDLSGQSASVLAHDVWNSLARINLSVEMLESKIDHNDLKLFLDVIMRSSLHIDNLTNELLRIRQAGA